MKADTFKNRIIKKAIREGREIYIQTLHENLDEATALDHEVWWIAHYGRRNVNPKTGCLANLTDGGEGTSGMVLSKEECERRRDRAKLMWANNPELRLHVSAACKIARADPVLEAKRIAAQKRTLAQPESVAHRSATQAQTWEDPVHREARLRGMEAARARPGYGERVAAGLKLFFSDPAQTARISEQFTAYWADPANREAQSKRFRTPEEVLASKLALYNPLFELEQSYVESKYALTRSALRCRHCGETLTMGNQKMLEGQLPRAHYRCAQEVFNISAGTGVYRTKTGHQQLRITPPANTDFTFKFAPAGVIFFDADGNEISRTRLPREYTRARIEGEKLLST